jgi:hypothetical protein
MDLTLFANCCRSVMRRSFNEHNFDSANTAWSHVRQMISHLANAGQGKTRFEALVTESKPRSLIQLFALFVNAPSIGGGHLTNAIGKRARQITFLHDTRPTSLKIIAPASIAFRMTPPTPDSAPGKPKQKLAEILAPLD